MANVFHVGLLVTWARIFGSIGGFRQKWQCQRQNGSSFDIFSAILLHTCLFCGGIKWKLAMAVNLAVVIFDSPLSSKNILRVSTTVQSRQVGTSNQTFCVNYINNFFFFFILKTRMNIHFITMKLTHPNIKYNKRIWSVLLFLFGPGA